ncbi:MAG: alpha/beta hydrolase [Gammaproteobacteria bacterium]|nr:alpha/beta hydrolase [Gammaproteobacteria bacterium]
MPVLRAPEGDIYFEQRGSRAAPPVLLIHGVGCQLIHWPESFLNRLVDADLRVIYFDNRDCGLSFEFAATSPSIIELIAARENPSELTPPYSLSDMATDAVHLLNHIGQSGAHVIGVSMGGMIAQRMLCEHPERVFSLTSIMSTTGNPEVGQPQPEAIAGLASNFVEMDRDAALANSRTVHNLLGGTHFVSTEVGMGRIAELAYDRALRPTGTLRQFAAIVTDGDRREELSKTRTPVLAIHGNMDPLVDLDGSEDLVNTVPNGKLLVMDQMGHDVPEPLIPEMADAIIEHIRRCEAKR